MANNEPLDVLQPTTLTAQEVIKRLQAAGFYDVYATTNGNIKIKGFNSISAELKQDKAGAWQPQVSVEMMSAPVFIPAVILVFICKMLQLNGGLVMVVCAWGMASGVWWREIRGRRWRDGLER